MTTFFFFNGQIFCFQSPGRNLSIQYLGGFNPKKPKPKMGFQTIFGFFGFFLEKGVESTYLNIPDHLRPTCFLHFFREISPGSDT